ncbi:MAG: AMP-binding protein [Clostridiales bacterium]|nr:AMP-binding protein [Clostridiales bacterium]
MNKKKFKDCLYPVRPIADLRELINSSASLFASKPAFYVKDAPGGKYRPITYEKFKEDIDSLGTALVDMGFKGKKIALIGENSYEWVVTYCAVANGTGVIVPLDKELHPGEINNLLERAKAAAVVYSKKMASAVKDAAAGIDHIKETIVMTDLPGLIKKGRDLMTEGDDRFTSAEIDREALCSLLFTSGTMGLAKGVMLSHRNLASNVFHMSKYVKIREDGVGLSVLPMHHSYEMTCDVFTGLYQGMAIAICEGLKHIAKNMAEVKATVMLSVPLVYESMHKKIWKQAEAAGKAGKMRKAIAISRMFKLYNNCPGIVKKLFKDIHAFTGGRMELFVAGGAAINPKVIEDFEAMGITMMQGYGMTECSPIIATNTDRYSKASAAGFIISGTEARIENPDEAGIGELVCKSQSVMMGYYDDPAETAKVLKDGWLSTGDYGYIDKDGMLHISGRKKNVIITKNGKNIFPEELEYYLTQRPYILEAMAYGVEDEKSGDTIIKAGIYPDYDSLAAEKGELTEEEIKEIVKAEIDCANEFMPAYKRVRRFEIRKTEFSKTTTKKIKRYSAENYN